MNVLPLQQRLLAGGQAPGPLDGLMGPATLAALIAELAAPAGRGIADRLAPPLAKALRQGAVWTAARVQHFLAQAAHETGGFTWLNELGGPRYLARYDGRPDLGNDQPGDGARFKGRGIFQLTGRANYARLGPRIGVDLVENPEAAADPANAARLAVLYWNDRDLSPLADADDLRGVTRRINGGANGLDDRRKWLARIRELWS